MRRLFLTVIPVIALLGSWWMPVAQATDNLCVDGSSGIEYCIRHWDTGGSIPYSLNSALPNDWKSAIRNAMSSWAVNTTINSFSDQGETASTDPAPTSSHIIWKGTIPAEWHGSCPPSNTLACTKVRWIFNGHAWDNHLFDGDMVFNSSISEMGTTCWRRTDTPFGTILLGYDVETVALHELGHYIGVAHTPDTGAAMYPSYQDCNRALSVHEWQSGNALYDNHGHA